MTEKTPLNPAGFGERFLAFFIDIFPFFLGSALSAFLIAISFRTVVIPRPFALLWSLLWLSLFILYHAWFNSEGRVSLGKRLLGLQVLGDDGNPLSRKQSLLRAAGYVLSGAFFNLGFLWALFHPRKKAWHDLLAKSRVVELREKTPRTRLLLKLCSGGLMAATAIYFLWINVLLPRSYQREMVQNAKIALEALGKMQEVHKNRHGGYTDELTDLAGLTDDPVQFSQDVMNVFEPGIEIKADRKSYTMTARARDDRKTLLSITGPGGETAAETAPEKTEAAPAGKPQKAAAPRLSEEAREIVDALVEEIQKRPDRLGRFFKEPSPRQAAEKIWQAAVSPGKDGASRVGGVEIAGEEYFQALRKEKAAVVSELEKTLKSR